eukprot:2914647-Prymnesium_polylepis.1
MLVKPPEAGAPPSVQEEPPEMKALQARLAKAEADRGAAEEAKTTTEEKAKRAAQQAEVTKKEDASAARIRELEKENAAEKAKAAASASSVVAGSDDPDKQTLADKFLKAEVTAAKAVAVVELMKEQKEAENL